MAKDFKVNKKGQVTIFIIIGILIIVGLVGFLLINTQTSSEPKESIVKPTKELTISKNIVETCLKESSEKAIIEMKSFGGNINTTGTITNIQDYRATPNDKEDLENNAKEIIAKRVEECVTSKRDNLNFSVSFGQASVKTIFDSSNLNIQLIMDTIVRTDNSSLSFKNYEFTLDTSLLQLSNFAKTISRPPYYDGEKYCITCLKEFSNENLVAINFFQINKTDVASITTINKNNISEEFLFRI